MSKIEIMATLWPDMPHYKYFMRHPLISGVRLNTAMADETLLAKEMEQAVAESCGTPLYFDVKGRQLRITKVYNVDGNLELDINHPIEVETPTTVLFKAGADRALLKEVKNGDHLVFEGGPQYALRPGESLNIRSPSLKVLGDLFTSQQLRFLDIAMESGIRRYMLSYATSGEEIEELRKIVGPREVIAKIESPAGLKWAETYKLPDNVHYLTARGDLFVEVERPHHILSATRKLIEKDSKAIVGSRILLSLSPHKDPNTGKVVEETVPSCSDINEIAWLLECGYKRFMFCDGLCLNKNALDRAINVLDAIAKDYEGCHRG